MGFEQLMLLLLFFLVSFCSSVTGSVSYDHKAIVVNGQRRILISGSIHYPRSTPEMWPDLIQKAKDGGLDVIQTYVFWNGHEPSPGKYYFEGRYDLVKFIKLAHQAGLYVHLRIGPYVCAEWNFGGFPVWLKYVPGIKFRTNNGPFKAAMQGFTQKIVNMMKAERLFETQGGPIILSQIENEYGPLESGPADHAYANWAAQMAVSLGTGVPWVMCKQSDAPDPVIDACNGFYCDWYTPNKAYKPKVWTENWTGWFTGFGSPVPHRPAEDIAFSVARFIQKGSSYMNYYMYHEGTNFGRTAGGPFISTSYDYDAPLDEYGNSAMFQIPAGNYLSSSLHFQGPCKSTKVHVSIQGKIIAPVKSNWTGDLESWIQFSNVNGLTVDGQGGQIDGSGDTWWACAGKSDTLKGCKRPTSLKFHACHNLHMSGISSVNNPSNHISINQCESAMISNVNLVAPENSPNTDGVDISQSTNVMIHDSFIGTGDDCVAINSRSSLINITNVACGPGHGISVGSVRDDGWGIENVHVSNCNLTGTKNGVRIKTFKNGSGYVKNIAFEQTTLNNVRNPIIIDENYCPFGCVSKGDGVQVSNVTYSGIQGTSADSRGIVLGCSPKVPCENIDLKDIHITTVSRATC